MPYKDSNGEIIGIIEDFRDIGILKQKEDALREAQQVLSLINKQLKQKVQQQIQEFSEEKNRYMALIQNIPQSIFQKNTMLQYVFANNNFLKSLNMDLQAISGKTDWDIFPEDLASKYNEDDKRILENGQVLQTTETFPKQGEYVEVMTVKAPIKDDEGNITGILGIFWESSKEQSMDKSSNKPVEGSNGGEDH
jgi:PAS domain S-box-containing protein